MDHKTRMDHKARTEQKGSKERKSMKTIGLIGGMSWESTVTYYQVINETIVKELGGLHSAKILLYSVDFAEIERLQQIGDWEESARILTDIAMRLEKAGADMILIGANTMHKVFPEMEKHLSIPIIHVADATADRLKECGITRVGLLGTKYTLLEVFYKDRLTDAGIEVLIPDSEGVASINSIIYDELCLGKILPGSKEKARQLIRELKAAGAQGIILGCTELDLLIKEEDSELPLFDTTLIHAERAAQLAIEEEKSC